MKIKDIVLTVIFILLIGVISVFAWLKAPTEYSAGERRFLKERPVLSSEAVLNGEYMKDFEEYTVDQFPFRDDLRGVKALFSTYVLNKMDNNGLFAVNGHISKLEYPVNPDMMDNAAEKFDFLYERFIKGKTDKVYLSVVPDKNIFFGEQGYLTIDYEKFISDFREKVPYMKYIDIVPFLSPDDFYRTDSHWKQEEIRDIALHIAKEMGSDADVEYAVNTLDVPFRGVYLGQSALPFKADTIKYLTNDILSSSKVYYYDTGMKEEGDLYNMEKAKGKDPYEMFLSGTTPLVEIENPNASSGKHLVVFRDSYGSSLVPLLVPAYEKISVVDIRYIQSNFVGNFVDFSDADVLFLYSTTLLNNSTALR